MNEIGLPDIAAKLGAAPEAVAAFVVFVAPYLVSPLSAIWKRWRKTSGPDTRTIIKVLTGLIVGVGGFALGLYGYDVRGVLNAVMAAVLAYLKTVGDYERDVNVQAKATKVAARTDAPADDIPPETAATLAEVQAEVARQTSTFPAPAFADDAPMAAQRSTT